MQLAFGDILDAEHKFKHKDEEIAKQIRSKIQTRCQNPRLGDFLIVRTTYRQNAGMCSIAIWLKLNRPHHVCPRDNG